MKFDNNLASYRLFYSFLKALKYLKNIQAMI